MYKWTCEGLEYALQHAPAAVALPQDHHVVQFLSGGIAGMLAWLSVYPLDVIKTRIQVKADGPKPPVM